MCPDGTWIALRNFCHHKIVVRCINVPELVVHAFKNTHSTKICTHAYLSHNKPIVFRQGLSFPRQYLEALKHRLENRHVQTEFAGHHQAVTGEYLSRLRDDRWRLLVHEQKGIEIVPDGNKTLASFCFIINQAAMVDCL